MPQDWTLTIVVWIVCGLASGWIGQVRHDPSPTTWFVAGILLGPLGVLLALIFAKPKATPMVVAPAMVVAAPVAAAPASVPITGRAYQCPHCSRPIPGDAAFCPSCGGRLTMSSAASSTATAFAQPQAVAAATPTGTGSKIALIAVVAVIVVGVALLWQSGVLSRVSGPGPVNADLPPAGSIWFGASFDTTTFHVNGQRTTFKVGDPLALVGHLTRTVNPGEAILRIVVDGIQVANETISLSGGASNVIGVTYATPFNGTYAFTMTDIGGNTLASGTIAVLPQ